MGYSKGFLALVLLCSIANAQKYLNPKEEYEVVDGSIYDYFVNITATEKEKEGVMGAIKEIISNAPNSTNWEQLAEVIRVGKLEENIENLGGEKSRKVVKNLQLLYRNTENISALTAYINACLEFMSIESLSREEKMYLFAELLGPKRYQTWYKANPRVRKAMGLEKVYEFPKEQIDFLVNYWNETPILKEEVLIYTLRVAAEHLFNPSLNLPVLPTLIRFLDSFKRSVYPEHSSEVNNLFSFGSRDEIDRRFGNLLEPRIYDFNFTVIDEIENELAEHPEYESSLISQLNGKGPVLGYFGHFPLHSNDRFEALKVYQSFIDAVKNNSDQQIKAFSTFLKQYIDMDEASKTTFEEVMTTNMTRDKCWEMWRNQSITQKAVGMVKLVNLLDEQFGIKTCLANVIELKNTDKLIEYWNQHPALGNLSTFFPINQKFKETLKTMLADTKDLTRISIQHMLKTLRLFVHDNPKFIELFEAIRTLHSINLEPVWMVMKQFLELSVDSRKKYIDINFGDGSLKNLGDFFKAIQKISDVEKGFEESFLKPNEQWTEEQMEKLLELLKVLEKTKYSDEVDRVFDVIPEDRSTVCDDIVHSNAAHEELFVKLFDMADSFGKDYYDMSCLSSYVQRAPGKK